MDKLVIETSAFDIKVGDVIRRYPQLGPYMTETGYSDHTVLNCQNLDGVAMRIECDGGYIIGQTSATVHRVV